MDDRQGASRPTVAEPDGPECPRLDLAQDRRRRQDRHAGGNLDGSLDRLDIVEFEGHPNVNAMLAEEPIDRPSNRQPAFKADKGLAVELLDGDLFQLREPM